MHIFFQAKSFQACIVRSRKSIYFCTRQIIIASLQSFLSPKGNIFFSYFFSHEMFHFSVERKLKFSGFHLFIVLPRLSSPFRVTAVATVELCSQCTFFVLSSILEQNQQQSRWHHCPQVHHVIMASFSLLLRSTDNTNQWQHKIRGKILHF